MIMKAFQTYASPRALPSAEAVRLGVLLNLQKPNRLDDFQLADAVAEGLPTKSVDAISGFINTLDRNAIYKIVSEPTLRRARSKRNKKLSRDVSERVYEMSRVIDQAARVFHGDSGKMQRFMTRPNPILDGKTPFDLASSSSAGANAVVKLLLQAEAGVAV